MYIAIYNRYSPFPVSFHLKYLSSTSARSSDRLPQRQSILFPYCRVCPLEHSKVSKQLPFGFRVTLPLPRTPKGSGNAGDPNNLAVPGLGTPPKSQPPCFLIASIKAFAKSDEAIRITLVSARERPMRLTLPYHPIHWSMMAHCILLTLDFDISK